MSGAKIDGKLSSINKILKGGEIVEIITNKNAKPSRKWLEHVKTIFAKKHIKNNTQILKSLIEYKSSSIEADIGFKEWNPFQENLTTTGIDAQARWVIGNIDDGTF